MEVLRKPNNPFFSFSGFSWSGAVWFDDLPLKNLDMVLWCSLAEGMLLAVLLCPRAPGVGWPPCEDGVPELLVAVRGSSHGA